jgi:hypothetical protein
MGMTETRPPGRVVPKSFVYRGVCWRYSTQYQQTGMIQGADFGGRKLLVFFPEAAEDQEISMDLIFEDCRYASGPWEDPWIACAKKSTTGSGEWDSTALLVSVPATVSDAAVPDLVLSLPAGRAEP